MKRHRWLVVLAGGLCAGAAVSSACGFPDVEFTPADGGKVDAPAADTGALDARNDAPVTPPSDAHSDAHSDADADADAGPPPGIDAALLDVAVELDAGGKVDASGCTPTKCDCDEDGFDDINKPTCPNPTDCDDTDKRTHPGQLFLDKDGEAPRFGDWDCDNVVTKGYPESMSCSKLLGLGCTQVFGFTGVVPCGQSGTFIQCVNSGLLNLDCTVDPETVAQRVQVCK